MSTMTVQCIVEQRPDPESRVTLSDRHDAFGTPLSRLDWRVHDEEVRTVRRATRLFADELHRLGLPVPDLAPLITDDAVPFDLPDVAHPTGTTRMSADPLHGVVDTDCRVHGVEGLYVAGGSVFPTSGHANPTHMIVALAVRLADHLRPRLVPGARQEPVVVQPDPVPRTAPPAGRDGAAARRVLVTGATGLIGSRLVERLLAEGHAVRALTSRARHGGDDRVEWVVQDLREDGLDLRPLVRGCAAVLHLAAEQRVIEDMPAVNAEASGLLTRAAEDEGVRFLCFLSSVAVYGSPVGEAADEAAATLTADRDVTAEYWAPPFLRAYARSKVQGERRVAEEVRDLEVVVFRPTMVVDEQRVAEIGRMPGLRRVIAANQRTQGVAVDDVVEAVVWALERALGRPSPRPGVTTYNLSDEAHPQRYRDVFQAVALRTGGPALPLPALPITLGRAVKWMQHGARLPMRRPMGSVSFPATRLHSDGYRHRTGIRVLTDRGLDALLVPHDDAE